MWENLSAWSDLVKPRAYFQLLTSQSYRMGIIKGFPGELQIGDNPTEDLSTVVTKAGFGTKVR